MEWISVKDRMPEIQVEVLAVFKNLRTPRSKDIVTTAYMRQNGTWSGADYGTAIEAVTFSDKGHFAVTHWMPLPEPPGRDTT